MAPAAEPHQGALPWTLQGVQEVHHCTVLFCLHLVPYLQCTLLDAVQPRLAGLLVKEGRHLPRTAIQRHFLACAPHSPGCCFLHVAQAFRTTLGLHYVQGGATVHASSGQRHCTAEGVTVQAPFEAHQASPVGPNFDFFRHGGGSSVDAAYAAFLLGLDLEALVRNPTPQSLLTVLKGQWRVEGTGEGDGLGWRQSEGQGGADRKGQGRGKGEGQGGGNGEEETQGRGRVQSNGTGGRDATDGALAKRAAAASPRKRCKGGEASEGGQLQTGRKRAKAQGSAQEEGPVGETQCHAEYATAGSLDDRPTVPKGNFIVTEGSPLVTAGMAITTGKRPTVTQDRLKVAEPMPIVPENRFKVTQGKPTVTEHASAGPPGVIVAVSRGSRVRWWRHGQEGDSAYSLARNATHPTEGRTGGIHSASAPVLEMRGLQGRGLEGSVGMVSVEGCGAALHELWATDLAACVDASPLLVYQGQWIGAEGTPLVHQGQWEGTPMVCQGQREGWRCVVGSHAHRVLCCDLAGATLWETHMGDRVEGSACLWVPPGYTQGNTQRSTQGHTKGHAQAHAQGHTQTRGSSKNGSKRWGHAEGPLVVVGCYDGAVLFLSLEDGSVQWGFKAGDAVRGEPAVDPWHAHVWCGSHDGRLYCLDPTRRRCVWALPRAGEASRKTRRRLSDPLVTLSADRGVLEEEAAEGATLSPQEGPATDTTTATGTATTTATATATGTATATTGGTPTARPGGGAILASPVFDAARRRVVFCSLRGVVTCLGVGAMLRGCCAGGAWGAPARPRVGKEASSGREEASCGLAHSSGDPREGAQGDGAVTTLWRHSAAAPIFSTPVLLQESGTGASFVGFFSSLNSPVHMNQCSGPT